MAEHLRHQSYKHLSLVRAVAHCHRQGGHAVGPVGAFHVEWGDTAPSVDYDSSHNAYQYYSLQAISILLTVEYREELTKRKQVAHAIL